jgi:hypothetical protein
MCFFAGTSRSYSSDKIVAVSDTNIFARKASPDKQFIVYQMQLRSKDPVAMILPLPVAGKSRADAVRFISLESNPSFFSDIRRCFERPVYYPRSHSDGGAGFSFGGPDFLPPPPLPVVEVGRFIASYVPSIKDFSRLNQKFVLPKNVWEALPQYKDYGFAIFQLDINKNKDSRIHSMAFEFNTRLENTLFFPTMHVHDGKIHPKEHFDHTFFFQTNHIGKIRQSETLASFERAGIFVKDAISSEIVYPQNYIYSKKMQGLLPNEDTLCESKFIV